MATRYHTGQNPVQDGAGVVRMASWLADRDSIGNKSVGQQDLVSFRRGGAPQRLKGNFLLLCQPGFLLA
ncbi:MAG TPA: hypothetical protein VJM82_02255 [Nitrospiraceae bacterium]|nr:hypothetical protein [Nitrospiraceae bacterium]